jgi:hypothetical protein
MRSTLAKPTEGAPPAKPRRDDFRCHTLGQAFGIGSSVTTSPLLEIKPKRDWAQHTAHRGSKASLVRRESSMPPRTKQNCFGSLLILP